MSQPGYRRQTRSSSRASKKRTDLEVAPPGSDCDGGVDGSPCDDGTGRPRRAVYRHPDTRLVCQFHTVGKGGSAHDNGQVRYVYFRRKADHFKIGLSQDPNGAGARFPGSRLLDSIEIPQTKLGKHGPVSKAVEGAARLRFALLTGGVFDLAENSETAHVPVTLSDDESVRLFRLSVNLVLGMIDRLDLDPAVAELVAERRD